MRELLIRYLLGELEPHEHDAVQRQLAESAELRRELAHLRSCFAASCQSDDDPDEPPRGLAERTTVRVAESDSYDALPTRERALGEAADPPVGALGWSLADLTVAGGVILAVSMLLFPAIRDSRDGTRRNVCQNNQYQLWRVIATYKENNRGYVPFVQPNENAGIYTVQLVKSEYISADDLVKLLVCPGAPLADSIRAKQFAIEIPTTEQLRAMRPDELQEARRKMSPFYAYCIGYRVGQQYFYIRDGQFQTPVLCDGPGTEDDGLMSPNHGGSIVQVINLDGSLKVLTSCKVQGGTDDLFLNTAGDVAAGYGRQDSVLGRSEATPGIFATELGWYSNSPRPLGQPLPYGGRSAP
ncbi:MAG: hypothetical protein L0228_21555 [Planctomycetes bacterium]|nr:hypothetical protein [Planctomycetota bacterium]